MIGRYIAAFFSALDFHFARFWPEWLVTLLIAVGIVGGGYLFVLAPPANFPQDSIVSISKGESAVEISSALAKANIIQHPRVLRTLLRLSGADGTIHTGAYRFAYPQNVLTIAFRLATADSGIAPVKITYPEGLTARAMASLTAKAMPEISASDFLSSAQPYEGYLFPDTYVFAPDTTAASAVTALRANFIKKTQPLMSSVAKSGHSFADIVTMASIVEKEARTPEAKKMVAGILWNRIKAGMPLQVDAVFGYINARATYSPSFDDLTIDSPYNTYKNKGLPPGPIDNPGLTSLEATINPTPSKYLFYLTGRDGQMHYANTFAEHKANRAKYLD